MTDKKNETNADNTRKTLTLKTQSSASVSGSSSGRAISSNKKSVVVETKRRKFVRPDLQDNAKDKKKTPATEAQNASSAVSSNDKAEKSFTKPRVASSSRRKTFSNSSSSNNSFSQTLSATEQEARKQALQAAQQRAILEQQRQAELQKKLLEEAQEKARLEAIAKENEEKERLAAEAKAIAEQKSQAAEAAKQATTVNQVNKTTTKPVTSSSSSTNKFSSPSSAKAGENTSAAVSRAKPVAKDGDKASPVRRRPEMDSPAPRRAPAKVEQKPAKPSRNEEERRKGKITVTTAFDDEEQIRGRSIASMRRRQEKIKKAQREEVREKVVREVIIPETITLQELAQRMAERSVDVIKYLMKQGQMLKPGDVIEADMAQLIAEEFGHNVRRVAESDVEDAFFNIEDKVENFVSRPPVVTVMGHVDHGKTSLLDALRKANIVANEAGGITQHIGAYQVEHQDKKITFIDTPGHAAFTAMRARGAQITDIAILVVAADDGVMPQTIESISHAKAANVPIIVAINKIDKPDADPQRVRTELLQHEVFVESMGGDVLEIEVSAKAGTNLDKLLETILLQAEILDLKADPNRSAEGAVIEAKLDKGRGAVATVLVQKGTLSLGDIVVAGSKWGRVRALINDRGQFITKASLSMPVEILGLQGAPGAGDRLAVVKHESQAREISEYRERQQREKNIARQTSARGSLEQMMSQLQTSDLKEIPLVIKGDVQGSVEAIVGALEKLGTNEVRANIIYSGVGGITETDISLAESSNAMIVGFNVRATKQANDAAHAQNITLNYYNIIYDLVDDIKAAMSGLLTPERRETFLGNAEVLEIFNITKVGKIAGCRITDGKIERGAGVRLIRDNVVIHEGKLKVLKRFKDEVSEAVAGQECGMAFDNYEDMRVGDVIEAFRIEHLARKL